jgi:predicted nuclease with TOPRIM domain
MPTSRKRGGKKAHNKRVKARNEKLRGEQKKMKETYAKLFQEKLDEIQNKFSGLTENDEIDVKQFTESLKVELPKPIGNQG